MTTEARPTKHTLYYAIRQNKPGEEHLAFAVSRSTFLRWCKELEVEVPNAHPGGTKKGQSFGGEKTGKPPKETLAIEARTMTMQQLQAKYRRTYWTIWNWCKQYGLTPPKGGKAPPEPEPVSAPASLPTVDSVPRLAVERPSYWCQPNIGAM